MCDLEEAIFQRRALHAQVNQVIRMVTAAGSVTTFAGKMSIPGNANGVSGAARFYYPVAVAGHWIRTSAPSCATLRDRAQELGETLARAKLNAYSAVRKIRWEGAWCRKDISDKAFKD